MAAGDTFARALRACAVAGALATAAVAPSAASASPFNPSGVVKPQLGFNTNQSGNWFGYNQGTIEQGGKLFNSISGDWTVPTASQHTKGQAEFSATWIGIGGGCIDAGCALTDPTSLIQTGTEQDVGSNGTTSYSAWWELVPVPSITISGFPVRPGDRMHANIAEVVPGSNVWTITLTDQTTGRTFSQTVPYASSHATAEWIEETPLTIGNRRDRHRGAAQPHRDAVR